MARILAYSPSRAEVDKSDFSKNQLSCINSLTNQFSGSISFDPSIILYSSPAERVSKVKISENVNNINKKTVEKSTLNVNRRESFQNENKDNEGNFNFNKDYFTDLISDNFLNVWESFYESERIKDVDLLEEDSSKNEVLQSLSNNLSLNADNYFTNILLNNQKSITEDKNFFLDNVSSSKEFLPSDFNISSEICFSEYSDDSLNGINIYKHDWDHLFHTCYNVTGFNNETNKPLQDMLPSIKSKRGRKRIYQSLNELEREEMKRERNNKACQKFRRSRKFCQKTLFEKESILLQRNLNLKEQLLALTKQVMLLKEKLFHQNPTITDN
nr:putative uncharacterized protein DDB_G0286333 [Hydra vulgaris]